MKIFRSQERSRMRKKTKYFRVQIVLEWQIPSQTLSFQTDFRVHTLYTWPSLTDFCVHLVHLGEGIRVGMSGVIARVTECVSWLSRSWDSEYLALPSGTLIFWNGHLGKNAKKSPLNWRKCLPRPNFRAFIPSDKLQ